MSKPLIFVSCGQFTEAEKRLGQDIKSLVEAMGFDAFFAEEVQDLNGLDDNILNALRKCAGFITVLHPRGEITRPDGTRHVRASVWIEQEIAIATYIQRVERRPLPVMAFIQNFVGLEGIRQLLQLNPLPFADESDVLAALAKRLPDWKNFPRSSIYVQLVSERARGAQEGHPTSCLLGILVNDSNKKIEKWDGQLRIPARLLDDWFEKQNSSGFELVKSRTIGVSLGREVKCEEANQRCFRFSHEDFGSVAPHETRKFILAAYCTECALSPREPPAAVGEAKVHLTVWIEGDAYGTEETIKGLAEAREAAGL